MYFSIFILVGQMPKFPSEIVYLSSENGYIKENTYIGSKR